jgi:hypothetical protein
VKWILAGFVLLSSAAVASENCTKEQYDRDRKLIDNAIDAGTIARGPKGLRDSILVQENMWFGMNYPEQITFMQSFECAMGGAVGKKLLFMDVRSLDTGRLLASWFNGTLTPTEQSPPRPTEHSPPPPTPQTSKPE